MVEAGAGLGAELGEIPAASAGMTDLFRAGMTDLGARGRRSWGRGEAAAAAAGWGGDRLHLFQRVDGGERDIAALWAVAFDDASEHAEGAAGLREWLIAFSDGEAWGAYGDRVVGWDAPHGAIRVLNGGTVVWLLAAPDSEAADTIAERLLTANAPILWAP